MKNPLQKEFDDFARTCFKDISRQQYIDLRRTFFGGACALWAVIMGNLSEGEDTTPKDLAVVSEVYREMMEFNEAVKRREK